MTSSGEINIRFGDNHKQFVLELLLARPRNFFAVIVLFFGECMAWPNWFFLLFAIIPLLLTSFYLLVSCIHRFSNYAQNLCGHAITVALHIVMFEHRQHWAPSLLLLSIVGSFLIFSEKIDLVVWFSYLYMWLICQVSFKKAELFSCICLLWFNMTQTQGNYLLTFVEIFLK